MPRKPQGWRDEEYDRAVAEKDLLYQTSLQKKTRAAQEAYKNKRREVVSWQDKRNVDLKRNGNSRKQTSGKEILSKSQHAKEMFFSYIILLQR